MKIQFLSSPHEGDNLDSYFTPLPPNTINFAEKDKQGLLHS